MSIRDQLAEIITVPAFRAWLETKDPAEEFNYGDNQNCCVGQFLKASPAFQALIVGYGEYWGVGGEYVRIGPKWGDGGDNWVYLPRAIEQAVWAKSRTFGEVLTDLNAFC